MGALANLPAAVPTGSHFPWLSVVTFLPLAGAVVLAFLPRGNLGGIRAWSLGVSLVPFRSAVALATQFHASERGFQLVERATWVPALHFEYFLGVDGVSVFLVLLTTFLMPAGVLVSWRIDRDVKGYFLALLVLETAMIGSFL